MIYETKIRVINTGKYPDKNLFIECIYSDENKYPLSVWIRNPYSTDDSQRFYYQVKDTFKAVYIYTLLSAHFTKMDRHIINIDTIKDLLAAFCPTMDGVSAVNEWDIGDGIL